MRLEALQRASRSILPAALAGSCRLAFADDGSVVFLADNGAVAAKLRQLTARMTAHLSALDREVTGMRVEVQPRGNFSHKQSPPPRTMDPSAIDAFSRLSQALPEGPLKEAVDRLLVHRTRGQAG